MTVKTDYSRFDIHDELTAPEGSVPILKGVSTAGGSVSKLVGVLANAPSALRAFIRMRTCSRAVGSSTACASRAVGISMRTCRWRSRRVIPTLVPFSGAPGTSENSASSPLEMRLANSRSSRSCVAVTSRRRTT